MTGRWRQRGEAAGDGTGARALHGGSGRGLPWLLALLLLVALAAFGARYHWVEEAGTAERDAYVAKAETLAAGEVPRDPFRPLLYPLLTAALHRLGLPAFAAARWVSNAAAVALVLLAWAFGRRLGRRRGDARDDGGRELGLWAALATAVNPNLWILGQHASTDMTFAALGAGAWLAALAYLERPRLRTAALAGLLFGLAAFTRGSALFLVPGLALAWVLVAWRGPEAPGEAAGSGGESPRRQALPARLGELALAAGVAVLALLPHWALRSATFGDPFHDENWKNLAWKLYGYPDWSYLERVPFSGLGEILARDPWGVLAGGAAELERFFLGGGLSQLLGTPLHALLLGVGAAVLLLHRPWRAGWALAAAGALVAGTALAFFAWGRLLLAVLPAANAVAFGALAGGSAERLRRGLERRLGERDGRRWLRPWLEPGRWRLASRLGALALVALLAVKTFAFRLPAFVDRHPYGEVAVLRTLEERLGPGEALAGTSPFLGRYLEHEYVALPDAFGEEIEQPALWFGRVRPVLEEGNVRYLVAGRLDLRDRPESLLAEEPPVPWLAPVEAGETAAEEGVRVWRVETPSPRSPRRE